MWVPPTTATQECLDGDDERKTAYENNENSIVVVVGHVVRVVYQNEEGESGMDHG